MTDERRPAPEPPADGSGSTGGAQQDGPARIGLHRAVASFRGPLTLFLVFLIALNSIGATLFLSARRSVEQAAERSLALEVRLKTLSLSRWSFERRQDAVALADQIGIGEKLGDWLAAGAKAGDPRAERLRERLVSVHVYGTYSGSMLATPEGRTLLRASGPDAATDEDMRQAAREAARTGAVQFTLLHAAPTPGGAPQMHIAAPVRGPNGRSPLAVVVLTVDPRIQFWPLADAWPGLERSARVLLVERRGDRVAFLNASAFGAGARRPSVPIDSDLPAAAAARRETRVLRARDADGSPILAATAPVPGMSWGVAAHIDRREVEAPVRAIALAGGGTITVLTALAALLLVGAWRREQELLIIRQAQAESDRRRLAARFDLLSRYANDIILLTDGEGRIAEANDRALTAYGYRHGEIVGRYFADLESPRRGRGDPHGFRSSGAVFEDLHRRRDGTTFPVEVSEARMTLEGRPWRQFIIRDITERKRAEAETVRLATIVGASPDPIVSCSLDGEVLSWNPAAERLTGFKASDMIGRSIETLAPESDRAAVREALRRVAAGEMIEDAEVVRLHKDGSPLHLVTTRVPMRDPDGKVIGGLIIARDIGARRAAEAEAAANAAIMAAQFELSPDGVIVLDPTGQVILVNRRFQEMWNLPEEVMTAEDQVRGRRIVRDQLLDERVYLDRLAYLAAHPGANSRDELVLKDGRTIEQYSRPIELASGRYAGRVWYYRDVTEQKAALDQRSRLAAIVEFSDDAMFSLAADGTVITWNAAAERLYGWTAAEMIGRSIDLTVPEQRLHETRDSAVQILGGGAVEAFETVRKRKDGTLVDVLVSRAPIRDESGRVIAASIVVRDITARKRLEAEAAASAAILAAQFELSPDGVLVVDAEGGFITLNQRFVDMWRLPPEAIQSGSIDVGLPLVLAQLRNPDAFLADLERLLANPGESSHDELVLKDGRTIERYSRPLQVAPGKYAGRVWFFHDVTERLQALEERSRLAAIVEASQDAVYSADMDLRVQTWNHGAERLFGYAAEEIIGQPLSIMVPEDRRDEIHRNLAMTRVGETPPPLETLRIAKGGEKIDVLLSVAPILDEEGGTAAIAAIMSDIRPLKRQERALARTSRALAMLSEVNTALVRARTIGDLYQTMCDIAVTTGGYSMAWIGLAEGDAGKTVRPAASAGRVNGYLDTIRVSWADGAEGQGPTGRAIREGKTQINRASGSEARMEPWRQALLKRGFLSSLSLPLGEGEARFGAMNIYADTTEAFAAEELQVLEEMAGDITFGVRALNNRLVQERLAAIVESSSDAILSNTLEGTITSWNLGATAVYGYGAEESVGRRIEFLVPDDKREEHRLVLAQVARGESSGRFETVRLHKDGRRIDVSVTVSPTFDLNGQVDGVSEIVRDITEQKRAEADLIRAARFDSLTGLPNRASFVDALGQAIADAHRWKRGFAILFIDLDHFKDVNDTRGHPAGDELLRQVGRRLRDTLRETDAVARLGGDEFAVICRDLADGSGVAVLAQRLLDALEQPFLLDGHEVLTDASIGVVVHTGEAATPETLLSYADIALYRAKADGRGAFRFFTEEMDREVRERVSLAAELRHGIGAGELFLVYQPQVEEATGELCGLEALARWRHPKRGLVAPGIFVPVAEHMGLAIPLTRWVVGAAARQIRAWLDAGLEPPLVGVNLSGADFIAARNLELDLTSILAAHGVGPERLEIELTESVLLESSAEPFEVLRRLHERGFRVTIDDFGTGYSSLDYVRRFPVDRIKIDQSFVRDLERSQINAAITRATIGLAQALGLGVIAEGVETAGQRELLASWGCRQMQGFHFARPMDAEAVTTLLREKTSLPL